MGDKAIDINIPTSLPAAIAAIRAAVASADKVRIYVCGKNDGWYVDISQRAALDLLLVRGLNGRVLDVRTGDWALSSYRNVLYIDRAN